MRSFRVVETFNRPLGSTSAASGIGRGSPVPALRGVRPSLRRSRRAPTRAGIAGRRVPSFARGHGKRETPSRPRRATLTVHRAARGRTGRGDPAATSAGHNVPGPEPRPRIPHSAAASARRNSHGDRAQVGTLHHDEKRSIAKSGCGRVARKTWLAPLARRPAPASGHLRRDRAGHTVHLSPHGSS